MPDARRRRQHRADEIIAIESNVAATTAGARAVEAAGQGHIRFVTAEATTALDQLHSADVVVLNPPRAGAGARVCASIARLRPEIVAYLSCNPETLARDLAAFIEPSVGLTIESIQPFDMLPHTTHVETLVVLRRSVAGDVSGKFPPG